MSIPIDLFAFLLKIVIIGWLSVYLAVYKVKVRCKKTEKTSITPSMNLLSIKIQPVILKIDIWHEQIRWIWCFPMIVLINSLFPRCGSVWLQGAIYSSVGIFHYQIPSGINELQVIMVIICLSYTEESSFILQPVVENLHVYPLL